MRVGLTRLNKQEERNSWEMGEEKKRREGDRNGSVWLDWSSFRGASGSARLIQTHGSAQPASKVHLIHFCTLDKRVALQQHKSRRL